ncbi:MAG: 4Fe-4S binding protein [Bacteroidales bacterium]
MENPNLQQRKRIKKNIEWYLALLAIFILIIVYYSGKSRKQIFYAHYIQSFYDTTDFNIQPIKTGVYKLTPETNGDTSFISGGAGNGYAGKVKILVHYKNNNAIKKIHIIESSETHSYFQKVLRNDFIQKFNNKKISELLTGNNTIDAVTGATETSSAITQAIKQSALKLGEARDIKIQTKTSAKKALVGLKEVLILVMFTLGILARLPHFKYKNQLNWLTLIVGMVFLGFVLNQPITLTRINSFLLGYWPDWQNELYIYLLVVGTFIILLTSGKNIYCSSICPFGATQKILGKLGNAKSINPANKYFWVWAQRSLAWIAIFLALMYRNPTISNYEVYSGLFQFTATTYLFALLALTIVLSVFIRRPWCNYLCPLKPIFELMQLFKQKIHTLWTK